MGFYIEKAPSGVTRCNGCGEAIELHDMRIANYVSGWSSEYWHKKCGLEYLESTMILLHDDLEGYVDTTTTTQKLQKAGIIS